MAETIPDQFMTLYEAVLLVTEGHRLISNKLIPTQLEILKARGLFDQAFVKVQTLGQDMSCNWHNLLHFSKFMLINI